jgi:putative flippase GtrA
MTTGGCTSRGMGFVRLVRFVAYAGVGAIGTAAHYAVLTSLVLMQACGPWLASAFGASVGAVLNYVLNYRLTFRATASHGKTAPRFFAIATAGVGLNYALMLVLIQRLGASWLVAQLVTTVCVLLLTYSANSLWTFRLRRA